MCAGAISAARINRLYYGAQDPKSGGVAQGARVFSHPQCHHVPEVYDGIGAAEAERMGLDFRNNPPVMMRTANGNAQGWQIKLGSVRIGDVELREVDAIITPTALPYVLLGNSFLTQFQMTRLTDQMVLEKRL